MSITNLEEITYELNDEELKILPILINGFKNKKKESPIKAPEIVKRCNEYLTQTNIKVKLTEPRLRKLVNYIRTNSILPLIATSSGYYVSTDRMEIINQIESLEQRANSIARCALGLKHFLK